MEGDELSFQGAVQRLSNRIDAPTCQERRDGCSRSLGEGGPGSVVVDEGIVDLAGTEPF